MKEIYPELDDPDFTEYITNMEEFNIFSIPESSKYSNKEEFEKKSDEMCQFEKTYYQHFVSQYLSKRTPYRGILLYHGLGSGKTCSSITIAEGLIDNNKLTDEPSIWVISRNALKGSFEQEIFQTSKLFAKDRDLVKQCTGDKYYKIIPNADSMSNKDVEKRINTTIKSKYKIFGYVEFANIVNKWKKNKEFDKNINNKVIIIDEAHNLRNLDTKEKIIVEPLLDILDKGVNNRLVLLSATPMYNEPDEILWLFSLLLANDKRKDILDPLNLPNIYNNSGNIIKEVYEICAQLSKVYVSHIRGNNPFTFAARLNPPKEDTKFIENVPTITLSGETLPRKEKEWLSWIPGELVSSDLGKTQIDAIKNHETSKKKKVVLATLNQINICAFKKQIGTKNEYNYEEGEKGLNTVMQRVDDKIPYQYKYIKPKEPIFNPSYGKLSEFAGKLDTLSSIIRSSDGIVLIYSLYIWGGIIPVSLMLEHMGFSRHEERNLLNATVKKDTITYNGIKNPKYCIIAGDDELMGKTKINKLIKDINSSSNKNGEKIKVVIISPVAGEGVSFKNIREMHILNPWYHMNNQEQAIGRAIRNCSHSDLPLEKRNVTVYLHCTKYPDNKKETSDLHAYRLSSIKYKQIEEVYKILENNAIDCSLMKNINYYPKELFDFKMNITTSRNKQIQYTYGDNKDNIINCYTNNKKQVLDARSFREEVYRNFIPTLQQNLVNKLKFEDKNVYSFDELANMVHPNIDISTRVIQSIMYPFKLRNNKYIIYHNGKFILTTKKESKNIPMRLQYYEQKEEVVEKDTDCMLLDILKQFEQYPDDVALLNIYQSLDSDCWVKFAEEVIANSDDYTKDISKSMKLLEDKGLFIKNTELPLDTSSSSMKSSKFIGYIDIFSEEDKFEGYILDNNIFRKLTDNELERLKLKRKHTPFVDAKTQTVKSTNGTLQRYKNKKEPNSPYKFQFKLLLPNEKQKRYGVVCSSGLKKPQIQSELAKYKEGMKGNIVQLCYELMMQLYNDNKLWMPPLYKIKN